MWIIVGMVLVVALAAIGFLFGERQRHPQFARKRFMTPNELEFLRRLEEAVPDLRVHCQVAMGAVLKPAQQRSLDRARYASIRGRYSQKIIDYVLQRRDNGEILFIVELDDASHDAARDAARDAMLQEAGYLTVRWHSRNKPSVADIREQLKAAYTEHLAKTKLAA